MTIAVANVVLTDTFDQWRTRTNLIADALSTKILTVNSNAAIGNASVTGIFSSNTLYTTTLLGGMNGAGANLTIGSNTTFSSPAAFSANVTFNGTVNNLGTQANLRIAGANTTHRYLVGYSNNSVAFETLVDQIRVSELLDVNTASYGTTNTVSAGTIQANGAFLQYDTALSKWHIGRFPWQVGPSDNVGLGGAPDTFKLSIAGTLKATGNVQFGTSLLVSDTALSRVGINKASPAATLHVGGSIYLDGDFTTFYTSDARYKTNVYGISHVTGETLIRLLRPVSFVWDQEAISKNELIGPKPEGLDVGFLAQEVQRIFPQAVTERPDGSLAICYERFTPLVVAALQNLQQRVGILEGNGNS